MKYPNSINSVSSSLPFIVFDGASSKYYLFSAKGDICSVAQSRDLLNWSEPENLPLDSKWGSFISASCFGGKFYIVCSKIENGKKLVHIFSTSSLFSDFEELKSVYPIDIEDTARGENLFFDKNAKPWLLFCREKNVFIFPLFDNGAFTAQFPLYKVDENISFASLLLNKSGKMYLICEEEGGSVSVNYVKSESGTLLGPWQKSKAPLFKVGRGKIFIAENNTLVLIAKETQTSDTMLFEIEEKNSSLHILNEFSGNWKEADHETFEKQVFKPQWPDVNAVFKKLDISRPVNRSTVAKGRKSFLSKKKF